MKRRWTGWPTASCTGPSRIRRSTAVHNVFGADLGQSGRAPVCGDERADAGDDPGIESPGAGTVAGRKDEGWQIQRRTSDAYGAGAGLNWRAAAGDQRRGIRQLYLHRDGRSTYL